MISLLVIIYVPLISLACWLPKQLGRSSIAVINGCALMLLLVSALLLDLGFYNSFILSLIGFYLIVFVTHWSFRYLRFSKNGRINAIAFLILVCFPVYGVEAGDYFFFNSDAKAHLSQNGINLKDNFTIEQYDSWFDLHKGGIIFRLTISDNDKQGLLNKMRTDACPSDSSSQTRPYDNIRSVRNFCSITETLDYVRKRSSLSSSSEEITITIHKASNTLEFRSYD